ncbi:UDP-N-acetylmuramoyl-L-alanine--D-glutamate ligase [Maridesulfovibrio hydrothermalis]|uniref:UDP-N-acetylmuramoylalanine--D-glutamate ligase n=1 Tax=Maridesulfovibrio hydrothermalis AM13 = DSM 14728 TaxID=1121451 RepID=L0R6Y7_9BACT|nr:UDP-N-acetylmuramoyl-L-alanine--D-glutamate ligase [Maridesulfovibrio hydrothermalis]CCO22499.1 UDP-N-acetylmuramoylalanine--D-glutamate ligase [Maridesulfovibrio hydrothermalis AM13 = DSM 14728]
MDSAFVQQVTTTRMFTDRLAVVAGAGRSGIAAAKLLHALGATVRIVDANKKLTGAILEGLGDEARLMTGPFCQEQFAGADVIVVSPGIPVRKIRPFIGDLPARKIISELELASWFADEPKIAITGTNGKTTTTALIKHILEQSGRTAFAGANYGTPLSEYILEKGQCDVLVLEVSSFQLQNCRLFRPNAAILLNVSANHLDYHLDMAEYLAAKLKIFERQSSDGLAILPAEMRAVLDPKTFTRAEVKWFDGEKFPQQPNLPGNHNRLNIEAAWLALEKIGLTLEEFEAGLKTFTGKHHRIENIGTVRGVQFINDSKGTNLDAVKAALRSFEGPVKLLLGGKFKGGDVTELIPAMKGRVDEVALFGAGREHFEPALKNHFKISWHENLDKAVHKLFADSAAGDTILLSPGTASFDAYTGYEARGDHFKRIMEELS